MATAYNCTVKTYKGVPLVKGGTEVLYLSQGAAEGQLAGFLHKTYTQYYYTRENRGAIQVDDVIQNLEGCNYVSFQNNSHGGKIFFGFIDRLVYINDNNTEIQFTIDPFPTYLGDTTVRDYVYIIRNTTKNDTMTGNLVDDYLPQINVKQGRQIAALENIKCNMAVVYFACASAQASDMTANGNPSGIQVGLLTPQGIEDIQSRGGVIIGAYLMPSTWNTEIVSFGPGTLSGYPIDVGSWNNKKINSGVYHKIVLQTPQGSKSYHLNQFNGWKSGESGGNISFASVKMLFPSPALLIYPLNYNGVRDNLAEGILIQCPTLPISAAQVYTTKEFLGDFTSFLSGLGAGAATGGEVGILAAGVSGMANIGTKYFSKQFEAPTVTGIGSPGVMPDYSLQAQLIDYFPGGDALSKIDTYFDYYGYAQQCEMGKNDINLDDKAFLQTGSVMLAGSEADVELNARLMAGIKIRKTLS